MARGDAEQGPHPVDRHVGRKVAEMRISLGFGQTDLARALGVTFQQVQKYEKGSYRISASRLWDLARFLKVDVNYVFEGLAEDTNQQDPLPVVGACPGPTGTSLEIRRMAPRLSVRRQKIALDLMRDMAGIAAEVS